MATRDQHARYRAKDPDRAKASDKARRDRWLAQPGVRERERIKAIARRHGLTFEQAKEYDAARQRDRLRKDRHAQDVHQLSHERFEVR